MKTQQQLFDYRHMKNPYEGKDIKLNFLQNVFEGKDKNYELSEHEKVIFKKNVRMEGITPQANSDEELMRLYYPDELKCFQKRHTYMSDDGMYLYHLGIIDYLQDFNLNKKGENAFKGLIDDPT